MNNDYAWATHVPIVQSVLEIIKPDYILELGIGKHSTPLFSGYNHLAIENDAEWIAHVQKLMPEVNIQHHKLPYAVAATPINNINNTGKLSIFNYYRNLAIPNKGKRVLFIDGFVCTRMIALLALKDKFDVIIYHDAQPKSDRIYQYSKVDVQNFHKCYLTSKMAWTCVLSKTPIQDAIKQVIPSYVKAFRNKWRYNGEMEVING